MSVYSQFFSILDTPKNEKKSLPTKYPFSRKFPNTENFFREFFTSSASENRIHQANHQKMSLIYPESPSFPYQSTMQTPSTRNQKRFLRKKCKMFVDFWNIFAILGSNCFCFSTENQSRMYSELGTVELVFSDSVNSHPKRPDNEIGNHPGESTRSRDCS